MSQMYQQQNQQHQQNLKQMTIAGSSAFPKAQTLSHKDIFQQFYTNYKKSYDYSYYSKSDSDEITNGNLDDNKKKLYKIWGEMHDEYLKTHPQQKNDEITQKNKLKQNDKNQKPQTKKQHQNPPIQQQKKPQDQPNKIGQQQQIAKERLEEIQKAKPVMANNQGYNQHQQQQQHHIQQVQQQPIEHDKIGHQYPQYYQYHQQPTHQVIYSVPPANPIPAIQQPAYQQPHHYIHQQLAIYPQQQTYQTQYGYIPATAPPIHNPMMISNPPPMSYAAPAKLDISNYISSSLQK